MKTLILGPGSNWRSEIRYALESVQKLNDSEQTKQILLIDKDIYYKDKSILKSFTIIPKDLIHDYFSGKIRKRALGFWYSVFPIVNNNQD